MPRKLLSYLSVLPVCAAMLLFLLFPARYTACVRDGVSLWAVSVLPATFPFLFLTAIFTKSAAFGGFSKKVKPLARLFGVSGEGGCAVLLAAVSGYPVGARTVAELANRRLVGEERFRLACLATTSGPMFLVGVVGMAMLQDPAAGWGLLLAHFLGVWSVSLLLRLFVKKAPAEPSKPANRTNAAKFDGGELLSSVLSVLCVGGSIALFSAFGQMLADLLPAGTPPLIITLVRGLTEMTTGCSLAAALPFPLAMALSAFFVTFGGACVLFQQLVFLLPAGIKPLPFLLVKFAQGLFAAAAAFALALIY